MSAKTQLTYPDGSIVDYTYDTTNRLTGPKDKLTYTYNQASQLTHSLRAEGEAASYQYDKNGNLIKKTETDDDEDTQTTTYTYDYENRLIKVVKQEEDETKTISFKYDPFGRRIQKKLEETEDNETETKVYTYVYDNEDIILEYLTKTDDNETKTETTKYIHGPGIDEPLSIERKGETYYYHADGLGSITALTDKKQKVVESYTYDSFGNMKRKGDKVKNTYTFTGREWDKETNLYYYRARYYDAKLGRFISKDPILHPAIDSSKIKVCTQTISYSYFDEIKENPQNLNPYLMVLNNPVNLTDPTGLSTKCCIGGIEGVWRGVAARFVNIWCKCYWLCVPQGGMIWSGNWFAQQSTNGVLIYTGGGALRRGDSCLCRDPDGNSHVLRLMR